MLYSFNEIHFPFSALQISDTCWKQVPNIKQNFFYLFDISRTNVFTDTHSETSSFICTTILIDVSHLFISFVKVCSHFIVFDSFTRSFLNFLRSDEVFLVRLQEASFTKSTSQHRGCITCYFVGLRRALCLTKSHKITSKRYYNKEVHFWQGGADLQVFCIQGGLDPKST